MVKMPFTKEQQKTYLELLDYHLMRRARTGNWRDCYRCSIEGNPGVKTIAASFREIEKLQRRALGFSREDAEFNTPTGLSHYDESSIVYVCVSGHMTDAARPKEADIVKAQINRKYEIQEIIKSATKTQ
ncbi:MAG TPA: hypothetical protein VJJ76_01765 [archaeon]|nr:hypothetical protein [archaeon]